MSEGINFGDYMLLRKIAQGGMAEVFLARRQSFEGMERTLVVKRILPEMTQIPDFVTMFADEARLASRFSHPNVAQIYTFGEVEGVYYISMEYVDGLTVSQLKRRRRKQGVPLEIALRIVSDVCAGLHYAHELTDERGNLLGIVHRDVSPQNVMLSRDGVTKLIDFGVARAATQMHVTAISQIKGKLAYTAPEVLVPSGDRKIDRRADIFAVGVLLFEMVTGTRLFRRENEAATVLAVKFDEPCSVIDFGAPRALDDIIRRAVAKDPLERYQSAQEMQDALEELIAEQPKIATPSMMGRFLAELLDRFDDREDSFSCSESRAESLFVAQDLAIPQPQEAEAAKATDEPFRFALPELPSLDDIADNFNELAATYVDLPIIVNDRPSTSSSKMALAMAAFDALAELELPEESSEIAESRPRIYIPPPPIFAEPPALLAKSAMAAAQSEAIPAGALAAPAAPKTSSPLGEPEPAVAPTSEATRAPEPPERESGVDVGQKRRGHLLLVGIATMLFAIVIVIVFALILSSDASG